MSFNEKVEQWKKEKSEPVWDTQESSRMMVEVAKKLYKNLQKQQK